MENFFQSFRIEVLEIKNEIKIDLYWNRIAEN